MKAPKDVEDKIKESEEYAINFIKKREKGKKVPRDTPSLETNKGVVQTYIKNWGEYFDYLFSEKTITKLSIERMIKESQIPKVAEWYLYSLEKSGYNPSKYPYDIRFPYSVKKWLKKVEQDTSMSLKKLYYRYWFPLKALNYRKDNSDFSPLSWIASGMNAYIQNDFDYLMMVNGLEGTGKSTLAINLALRLKTLGLGFNPATHIFFKSTPEEYIISMIENTEKQVFIFDEARAHFWKRSSQTKEQKNRIMSLTMQRARNHIYLLCTRQPDDIDIDLRDSRVASVLYSIDKGEVAFLVNRNVGFSTKDPFGFKKLEWAFKRKEIRTPLQLRNEIVNLPSLYAYFKVGGLPKEVYQAYKELKMKLNKIGSINISTISKDRILSVVMNNEKISEMVAKKLKIDTALLKNVILGVYDKI